jgi:hypothetical protein
MQSTLLDYIVKQSLSDSICREELVTKKYDEYIKNINDAELHETLFFFKETSREHIELIKNKIQKIDSIL